MLAGGIQLSSISKLFHRTMNVPLMEKAYVGRSGRPLVIHESGGEVCFKERHVEANSSTLDRRGAGNDHRSLVGQSGKGVIAGSARDAAGAALQGADVRFVPQLGNLTTSAQGEFAVTDVAPGIYTVTISYVGFTSYEGSVTVTAGQTAKVAAVLEVASRGDSVIVTADRPRGEAEAINRTRAAENILQVLPAEVITSLPNANIADALGRMASVTIERDEGEGKYVQIRGTEPRLSNTMIDGVTVPSPESGVRQIKLDTIASDLVESVEINKTLQANIDADGIGGSVNLVTKTATRYTDHRPVRHWRLHAHHRRTHGRPIWRHHRQAVRREQEARRVDRRNLRLTTAAALTTSSLLLRPTA